MTTDTIFDFKEYLALRRGLIEGRLESYMQGHKKSLCFSYKTNSGEPKVLWDAMRYSVLSGGKRIRAILCLASAEALSGIPADERALPCACALELIHAMSLIHDDLPCLDNDDFRRGRPSNHKVYGEAMALLAGDALLMQASQLLIEESKNLVPASSVLDVVSALCQATGADGMVGGQVDDLNYTGATDKQLDENTLVSIHRRKTGALLSFATWSGAKLAGADDVMLSLFAKFGELLGMAFQITDDLLDTTGDMATLGKTPGKDEASNKLTFVRLFGIDGAKERLNEISKQAKAVLGEIKAQGKSKDLRPLESLFEYAINRVN